MCVTPQRYANLSVLIPTFNRAHCLRSAVESALAQTVRCREVLVIDDGSTDGTADLLASYGDAIRVVRQDNQGASVARNTGIAAAKSEWVALLDSDDTWEPDKIERQVAAVEADRCLVAHGTNAWVHPADGGTAIDFFSTRGLNSPSGPAVLDSHLAFQYALNTVFVTPSLLVKRSALLEVGGFDPSLSMYEDLDLLCRLAQRGSFGIDYKPLCHVRRQGPPGTSLSEQSAALRGHAARSLVYVYTKLLGSEQLTGAQRLWVRRRLSAKRADLAAINREQRGLIGSLAQFGQSVADHPSLASTSRALAGLIAGERGLAWGRRLRHGQRDGFYR